MIIFWEYKVGQLHAGTLEADLNGYGAAGWELVQIITRSTSDFVGVFKRLRGQK